MKIAHLILTYTDPKLTERLIKVLAHPQFDFYIHVDQKFSIEPYLYLKKYPNVFFIKDREDVRWAGYNTIKATFKCIREIVASGIQYGYINFMSGQDYPIRSAQYILDFFERNKGKQFIEYQSIDKDWIEAQPRISQYHLTNFKFKGKHRVERVLNMITPKRKLPNDLVPYGKAMFWVMEPERAMYVVRYVEEHPRLDRFFRFTWGSDEFVFQTILMNSAHRNELVNDDLRYIDWSGGGSHPKVLDKSDLDKILASDDLFIRKVNSKVSGELLDALDQHILATPSAKT
ncbi:beta-1,6-N-acetylglucosaminyltransferase [Mucilaginibacter daejeonensis]|uniref:beta-1,6-N-acetylglucosaminyltransferase n=1 Tax=Mucilaginibacter daejeonensis TaxID=398049 RepID=UPI001D178D5B|nr:beta-1,6-N-acetylglucosaminyltransferase [Mucilaginibacter daejeonensis]UEG53823.1 beta-1,6-N-acetylglucosaminyltransferase [Mucilaginibacter daejeonensis]